MAFNSQTAGAGNEPIMNAGIQSSETQMSFFAMLVNWSGNAVAKFGSGVRALQDARMMSTLSNMSDYQLTQIGIKRSDIPQYAEKLMMKS